jgi:hypothetical protein
VRQKCACFTSCVLCSEYGSGIARSLPDTRVSLNIDPRVRLLGLQPSPVPLPSQCLECLLRRKEKEENSDEAKRVDAGPCRFDDVAQDGVDTKYESRDIASPFVASDFRIVGFHTYSCGRTELCC